jgi:hypothetical protein
VLAGDFHRASPPVAISSRACARAHCGNDGDALSLARVRRKSRFGDIVMQNRTVEIVLGVLIAAAGIALMGVGVYDFSRIGDMEAAGQVHGLTSKVKIVYAILGKWGVLGVFGFVGVCVVISGGDKLLNAIRAVPKRDTAV